MIRSGGVVLCSLVAARGVGVGADYHLPGFAKDMSSVSRVTTAMSVSDKIKDPKNQDIVIAEMLNMKMTLRELESSGVDGLDADMRASCSVVQRECGGAGGCANETLLNQAPTMFSGVNATVLIEADKAVKGEAIGSVMALDKQSKTIQRKMDSVGTLKKLLEGTQNVTDARFGHHQGSVDAPLKGTIEALNAFESVVDIAKSGKTDKVADSLTAIHNVSNVTVIFPVVQPSVDSFKKEFQRVTVTQRALSASLAKPSLESLRKKIQILKRLGTGHGLTPEKKFTQGFPNGFKDVSQLPKDLETPLVKVMIGGDENSGELKTLMVPVMELGEKWSGLQGSWDPKKLPAGIKESSDAVIFLFQDAYSESESLGAVVTKMEPFAKCIEKMNLATFNFHDIAGALQKAPNLNRGNFATTFKPKLPTSLKANLVEIQELMKEPPTPEKLKKLKEYPHMADVIKGLEEFLGTVSDAESHDFIINGKAIATNVARFKKWMEEAAGIAKINECIQEASKLRAMSLKQDALRKLVASNPDIGVVSSGVKLVKVPIKIFRKIVATLKIKRKAGTRMEFKVVDDAFRELAYVTDGVLILAGAYEKRVEIRKFIEDWETRKQEIKATTDQKRKSKALKLLSDDLKTWLTNVINVTEELDKNLPRSFEKITDIKPTVDTVTKLPFMEIDEDDFKEMMTLISNPQAAAPILDFAGFRKRRSPSHADPLSAVQSFFDGIFNINRAPVTTPAAVLNNTMGTTEVPAEGMSTGALVAAVGVPVIAVCSVGAGLFYYFKVHKPKKQEEEDEKNGKNKTIRVIPDDVTPEQRQKITEAVEKSKCPEVPLQQVKVDKQSSEAVLRKYTSSDGQEIISIERDNQSTKAVTTAPVPDVNEKTKKIPAAPSTSQAVAVAVDRKTLNRKNEEHLRKAEALWNADKTACGTPVLYYMPESFDPKELQKMWHTPRIHIQKEKFKLKWNGVKHSYTIGENPAEETPPNSSFKAPAFWANDAPPYLFGPRDASAKTAHPVVPKDPSRKGTSVEDTQPSSRAHAAGDVKENPLKGCSIVLNDKKYTRVLNVTHVAAFHKQFEATEKAGGSMEAKAFTLKEILEGKTHDVYEPSEYWLQIADEEKKARLQAAGEVGSKPSSENLRTAHSIAEDEEKKEKYRKVDKDNLDFDCMPDGDLHLGPIPDVFKSDKGKILWVRAQTKRIISPHGHFNVDLALGIWLLQYIREREHFCEDLDFRWRAKFFTDASLVEAILDLVICIFKQEKSLIHVDGKICIVGDLHGHESDVTRILYGRSGQYPDMDQLFLFLGDYIDRGGNSLYVITLLFLHKIKAPHQFLLLRGNHEDEKTFMKYGFFEELLQVFKEGTASRLVDKFQEAFSLMPMAAVANGKVFTFHGGISKPLLEKDGLKYIRKDGEKLGGKFRTVWFALLWGDPQSNVHPDGPHVEVWVQSARIPAESKQILLNGNLPVYERFMKVHGIELIIRAHEPMDNGFCHTLGKLCLMTIFSSTNTRDVRDDRSRGQNLSGVVNLYPDGSYHVDTTSNPGTEWLHGNKSCKTVAIFNKKGRRRAR